MPSNIRLFSRVTFQEKLLFTKHLDTMIKSGIPVVDALETLKGQAKSKQFQKVILSVLSDVENGQKLAKSLGKHDDVFDEFYTSLIRVGEKSGTLERNLSFLAKQMSKDFRLRKKIKSAMLYPVIVFVTTAVMGGFISIFILPKLVEFFEAFNTELPVTTRALLFIANTMKDYGIIILLVLIGLGVLFKILIRLPKIKKSWHIIILKIPIFGDLITYNEVARFARNLGTLLKSGLPVVESIETTAGTLSNLKFRDDLLRIAQSLNQGKKIGSTMKDSRYGEYPPIVSRMIDVGEKSGNLDESLLYLADFYEDEIDDASKNLSTIIEPVLLLIIGLAVGFVAMAIISPIYELTGSIRK